jgi:hypothetical protein
MTSHLLCFPVVSWEAEFCWGRVQAFYGEAGSGMHSHSREAGFTRLWWIKGTISATLTAVRVEKTTKEPLQWGFSG